MDSYLFLRLFLKMRELMSFGYQIH